MPNKEENKAYQSQVSNIKKSSVFVSCGILMPKYVITALLTYFIHCKKLCVVGVIMLRKQFIPIEIIITEFRATNSFSLLSSLLGYENDMVKVINANRFSKNPQPTFRKIFRDFLWLLLKLETGHVSMKAL